jgi:hypothetical protein
MTIKFERKRNRSGSITHNPGWRLESGNGIFMGEVKWNPILRTYLFWSSSGWHYTVDEVGQILTFMRDVEVNLRP